MEKKYYKSDFDFFLDLKSCNGEEKSTLGWPQWDWSVILWTVSRANAVKVGVKDGVPFGCFNDNGRIHVVMKNHRLGPGVLKGEISQSLPDGIYPDGIRLEVSPETMGLELTLTKGDCATTAEIEAVLPLIKGEKGDKGDKGERGEKGDKGNGFTDEQIRKLDSLPSDEMLREELSAKQNKLSVSEDLELSNNNLSLTELAKMRSFVDRFNLRAGSTGYARIVDGKFDCMLNGLQLTYEEALFVDCVSQERSTTSSAVPSSFDGQNIARTNFEITIGNLGGLLQTFNLRNAEVIAIRSFNRNGAWILSSWTLCLAPKLRIITGPIYIGSIATGCFTDLPSLEYIGIMGLNVNLNLSSSPNLSFDCMQFIITNASAANTRTFTIHPTTYAKITDPDNPDYEQWHPLLALAEAKNISLATV